MNLQELRKEFRLGNLSRTNLMDVTNVYIRLSGELVGTIVTQLREDGSLEVMEICPVIDQEGSQALVAIAVREKIRQQVLTKAILNQPIEDAGWTW